MFVVLEGIDGSGKTTQADRIEAWLLALPGAARVVRTREPGGWVGGDVLRDLVLNHDFENPWSEWFLFMLDRCEHVAKVIDPALRADWIVLSDRYNPSTLAYQILSNESISDETAGHIMKIASQIGLPKPDVVLFLDVTVKTAMDRVGSRAKRDSFDARGGAYFERVRSAYELLMRTEGADGSWVRIDANRPPEEVFGDIQAVLSAKLRISAP